MTTINITDESGRMTQYYKRVFRNLMKVGIVLNILIAISFLLSLYINIDFISSAMCADLSLSLFFTSESFLGLMPPDLFVVLGGNSGSPFLAWIILSVLAYALGFFGIKMVKKYLVIHTYSINELQLDKNGPALYSANDNTLTRLLRLIFPPAASPVNISVNSSAGSYIIKGVGRIFQLYMFALLILNIVI